MRRRAGREGRRGHALLIALIALIAMTGIAGAILATSGASKQEVGRAIQRTHALYAAEAGICRAAVNLSTALPAGMGTETAPNAFSDGAFWGSAVLNADSTYSVTSIGSSGRARRAVLAVLRPGSSGALGGALFAGNSSNDPTYDLHLGGSGADADAIVGDVYSGSTMSFTGTSTLQGTPRATGAITTQAGTLIGSPPPVPESGVVVPGPNLAGMNYPVNHDIDVAADFASAAYVFRGAGISAWEMPDSNPSHIFRRDPSDRAALTSLTTKADYFLEDPYQPMATDVAGDAAQTAALATTIRLCDTNAAGSTDSADGNDKVYYIDGNLWLESLVTNSFKLSYAEASGCHVTFVVKGNIYIGDNLYLNDAARDGVAFIALKDATETDSGNVYFSNVGSDLVSEMNAAIFAENNVYANVADPSGQVHVTVNGSLIASDHVAIDADAGSVHTQLRVNVDPRLAGGRVQLPGLPSGSTLNPVYTVALWREVGAP